MKNVECLDCGAVFAIELLVVKNDTAMIWDAEETFCPYCGCDSLKIGESY